jgi:hypothetical protein
VDLKRAFVLRSVAFHAHPISALNVNVKLKHGTRIRSALGGEKGGGRVRRAAVVQAKRGIDGGVLRAGGG